uniref:Uncharacterized protein n=1 Tax=Medicago truncatula TaxID=3880 RepID=I3SEN9_MEDTR|nr:unknown [Medicago truncatula]
MVLFHATNADHILVAKSLSFPLIIPTTATVTASIHLCCKVQMGFSNPLFQS